MECTENVVKSATSLLTSNSEDCLLLTSRYWNKAQIEQSGSRAENIVEKRKLCHSVESHSAPAPPLPCIPQQMPSFLLLSPWIKSIISFSSGPSFSLSSHRVLFCLPWGFPKWALREKKGSHHFGFCFLLFICFVFIIFTCWLPRTHIQYAEVIGFSSFS